MKSLMMNKMVLSLLVLLFLIPAGCNRLLKKPQRYGMVVGVKTEGIEEYKRLHANTWPGVLKMIRKCHMHNFSIYLAELEKDQFYLFGYFEYYGNDYDADMAKMAADPTTKDWWSHTEPLQVPIPTRKEGEWWHFAEEVFYTD